MTQGTDDIEWLAREAGGAGYLNHLSAEIQARRPRELLAEALKAGSEAHRDLAALQEQRPSKLRGVWSPNDHESFAVPLNIERALAATVSNVSRMPELRVVLDGLHQVVRRNEELEAGIEHALAELEAKLETDSIDDAFSALRQAARFLQRVL